ncbi:uncharacterized protein [Dysidea avara]
MFVYHLFTIRMRMIPGYEGFQATEKAFPFSSSQYSIEDDLGNKTAVDKVGFPVSGEFCGDTKLWLEYAEYHDRVVSGKEKGRYLKYYCDKDRCGGFGNRMQAITVGLIVSMLSRRIFLLEFSQNPFDFSKFLIPNMINWRFKVNLQNVGHFNLMNNLRVDKHWSQVEGILLDSNSKEDVLLTTNIGMDVYMSNFGKKMLSKFLEMKVNSFHSYTVLYGCAMRYLFKHNPVIIDSVLREQKSLNLKTGHYVAVHIRTVIGEGVPSFSLPSEEYWKPYLECAVATAKNYAAPYCSGTCPVYVLTDTEKVKQYAIAQYGDYVMTSTVYELHIDHPRLHVPRLLEEAFVGILTDIEVAARSAVFISTEQSTFSDLIEGLGFFTNKTTFNLAHCPSSH